MTTFHEKISEVLGKLILEAGVSQTEFSRKYGINQVQLNKLLNQTERGANVKVAMELAAKIKLPPDTFFPPEERRRYFALPPESMGDGKERLTRLPILGYAGPGGAVEPGDSQVIRSLALPEGLPGDVQGIEVAQYALNFGDKYDLRAEDLLVVAALAVGEGDLAVVRIGEGLWLRRIFGEVGIGPDGRPERVGRKQLEWKAVHLARKL